MEDNKNQELQMKLKKRYITMLLTIGCLTVTFSGCGTNDTKDNDVQVLNVDTETLQETEQMNTEEATEFVETNTETETETEEAVTLDQYIGNWVCYYSDTSWIDISLYYMDGDLDDLCASVIEYYNADPEDPYICQDYADVPVEDNIVAEEYGFSYELIPQDDDSLKVIISYPEGAEFEGKAPEEYTFEKASDEVVTLEGNMRWLEANQPDDVSQDSTVSDEEETIETEETEEKYSDDELITAALGYLDTALADSIKNVHTTYEVDSVTDVKRGSSGHYTVRFYILFDGYTYEYFTVKLWDFDGLQYNGHE